MASIKLYAYLSDFSLKYLKPEDLGNAEKVLEAAHFSVHKPRPNDTDRINVGEVEVEVEMVPKDQLIQGAVAMLRMKAADLRDEGRKKAEEFDTAAEKLLALPMNPQPVSLEK